MASERTSEDPVVERGSLPLDIDDVHVLLQGQFIYLFWLFYFFMLTDGLPVV